MRITFNENTDHVHSQGRLTAYKKGETYTVPQAFGEECVKNGSGVEDKAKKTVKNAPKSAAKAPVKAKEANGDRP